MTVPVLKHYLGDAVYVAVDSETQMLVLTTEDGICATNTIYLDPTVLEALVVYLRDNLGVEL